MQKFKGINDFEKGKLYRIITKRGYKSIVFLEGEKIRSNAAIMDSNSNGSPSPVRYFKEQEIEQYELIGDYSE